MLNLPLNLVVEHFIRYVVVVQMAFYTLQMYRRNQDLYIFPIVVPEIQL